MTLDAAAEAGAITADLRALAPEPTVVPVAWTWTALLDNWETTDQLGMNVLGPLVALDPDRWFGLLAAMAGDPHPWTRRLALAVRETRAKLATGVKRPPGGRRPAPAGTRR